MTMKHRLSRIGSRSVHFYKKDYRQNKLVSSSCFSTTTSGGNESSDGNVATCDVIQGPSLLRTPVARPAPSLLYLPGLRSLPFWTNSEGRVAYGDPTVSQVIQHLEQNVDTIRQEYLDKSATLKSDYEATDHQSLHEGDWEWYSYLNKGSVQGQFALQFPHTAKVLNELRQQHVLFEGTPFGFCFFSKLHGQSSIQAHTAPMNLRLRIHLPLIVPKGDCGIRVGPITRPWVTDKAMVLDDSYDHQVWNKTEQERVLLLVDIWHPDISLTEKQEIVELFQNAKREGLWRR